MNETKFLSDYEAGLVDGTHDKWDRQPPPRYGLYGSDEYARGYRAGYISTPAHTAANVYEGISPAAEIFSPYADSTTEQLPLKPTITPDNRGFRCRCVLTPVGVIEPETRDWRSSWKVTALVLLGIAIVMILAKDIPL